MEKDKGTPGHFNRRVFISGVSAGTALTWLGTSAPAPARSPQIVETADGRLRGLASNGVLAFLGIPYGADTGGANRFKPPAPVAKWAGVRDATRFGATAPQTSSRGRTGNASPTMALFPGDPADVQISEDCLRLNVWTPAASTHRRRPVLVWLHGGGYSTGSASRPTYNGANFARTNDMVVVSVNHRLNVFGYAYLAEVLGPDYRTSGNVGNLDIVAALRWIRTNIAAFGGDPHNVTIRGQSGGGGKVTNLLAMPVAHGLFHKAIIESTPSLGGREIVDAAQTAEELVRTLGGKDKLLTAGQDELLNASMRVVRQTRREAYGPVVDGAVLPRQAYAPDATPLSAKVPLMIGRTRHEVAIFVSSRQIDDDAAALAILSSGSLPPIPLKPTVPWKDVLAAYRSEYPGASSRELVLLIGSDAGFGVVARTLADRKAAQPAPVYAFRFDRETKAANGLLRAVHGAETSLIFNNAAVDPLYAGDPTAAGLADRMCRSWGAFARTGNPEAEGGLGRWPRYDAQKRTTMLINDQSRPEEDPDGRLIDKFSEGMAG